VGGETVCCKGGDEGGTGMEEGYCKEGGGESDSTGNCQLTKSLGAALKHQPASFPVNKNGRFHRQRPQFPASGLNTRWR
jgi:hypothetical protein